MLSLNLKLIFVSFLLIFLDSRGWLGSIKNRVTDFSLPFKESFSLLGRQGLDELKFWIGLGNLRRENAKLERQVEELESRLVSLKDLSRENDLLRAQLGLKNIPSGVKVVLGRINGRLSQRPTVVLTDIGEGLAVQKGDLAIYRNFIFGRVLVVSGKSAQVQLLTDPEIYFDGLDIDSRNAKGEVRGNFGTALRMEKILPTEKMAVGDTIVDSLSGYVLGLVEEVEKEGTGILKTALLSVPYEMEKVEKVFILTR